LDRKGNGINLAETVEDFAHDASGASSKLPLHKGSHKKWDELTNCIIKKYTKPLKKEFGSLEKAVENNPKVVEKVLELIEKDLLFEIKKLPAGIKLN